MRAEQSGIPMAERNTRIWLFPIMKIRGMNTTTLVSVASATASPTSLTPATAARRGLRPRARSRAMFSITTTELSTSIPRARVSPVIVSTLKVPPEKCSQVRARRMEMGIESATTRVVRRRRRNANRTRIASPPPQIAVLSSWARLERMNSAWSKKIVTPKLPPRAGSASIRSITSWMRSEVSTTLAVPSFWIMP